MEKHSYYEYEIWGTNIDTNEEQHHYIIYLNTDYTGGDGAIESNEWFETEQEARIAAIKHIDLLESGE